jgi:hypothetical protein
MKADHIYIYSGGVTYTKTWNFGLATRFIGHTAYSYELQYTI